MLSKKSAIAKKKYLALSLTTALVAASQPVNVQAAVGESFGSKIVDATEARNTEEVLSLLERGINPNERGQFGTSALLRAANSGDLEIAKILIESGANVNVPDLGGATALHIAARKGDVAFVNFLLANSAKVNAVDKEGNTPLMISAVVGNADVAGILLRNGADADATNDSGETALHYATEERSSAVIDLLLAQGAATDFIDSEGYTAPEVAERKNDSVLVAKLDKRDPNHVMISMGSGFKSLSSKQKAKKAAEASKGKQLIQQLAQNDAIDLDEVEYLSNPSDPELSFFEPTRFEPASGERQVANVEKKSWLDGLTKAFDDAGAFDLASVQNFQEGDKYSLVELGSFKLRAFAEKRISELKNENPALANVDLVIFERGSGDNIEYYINGGVFETLSEAESICKKLAANGARCTPVETAMISNEQYASFGSGSSYSAPEVEAVEITENIVEDVSDFGSKTLAAVEAVQAPTIPSFPQAPSLPEISEEPAKKTVPLAVIEPIKEIEPISLPTVSMKKEDASLTELAGMESKKTATIEIPQIADLSDTEIEFAEEEEIAVPTIDDIVNDIYKEQEIAVVAPKVSVQPEVPAVSLPKETIAIAEPAPAPKLQVNIAPAVEKKLEQVSEVKQQIQALPTLSAEAPKVATKPEPVTIKFATPNVPNNDTFKPSITASTKPQVTIANNDTRKPILLSTAKAEPKPVRVIAEVPAAPALQSVKPKYTTLESLPEIKEVTAAKPIAAPSPRVDRFTVAKPVRVNDAYLPTATYSSTPTPSYTASAAPKVTYNDAYIPPAPSLSRREGRRMAKVEHFASADSAMGLYWKYREQGVLDGNITVRATRDLTGKPYYSSLIGEFRTNADAQAFCNKVYSADKLRCSVIDEIDYSAAVSPVQSVGSTKSYQRHSSRSNNRRTYQRHSSR